MELIGILPITILVFYIWYDGYRRDESEQKLLKQQLELWEVINPRWECPKCFNPRHGFQETCNKCGYVRVRK